MCTASVVARIRVKPCQAKGGKSNPKLSATTCLSWTTTSSRVIFTLYSLQAFAVPLTLLTVSGDWNIGDDVQLETQAIVADVKGKEG